MELRQKKIIGLDIGTRNIKVIGMNRTGVCGKWSIGSIPQGLVSSHGILAEDLLAGEIRDLIKENEIRGRRCSFCLPSQHVITRSVFHPSMDSDVLIENIRYDMEDYLPLDADEYYIDYRITKTVIINGREHWHILITAAPKKIVLSYLRVLKMAGLNPIYIDVPSNCLEKLLISTTPKTDLSNENNGNLCIVDIGCLSINIIIFSGGRYFIDKTFSLEDGVVSPVNQRGSNGTGHSSDNLPNDINPAIKQTQSKLVHIGDEIIKTIRYYENQMSGDAPINEIILLGGGSLIPGLPGSLMKNIGISVITFSDWMDRKKTGGISGLTGTDLMLMGNAIGSTIRRDSL
ncbi:MAG TPA: pilus assembly protein PilM [Clostridia bacterium]|nr:pilus assembly protein PilM [Clostridia bacterium]